MRGFTSMSHTVPEKKQTSLGLYVTAQEAFKMWKAEPDRIKILDVRTPEEYYFVGHAEMARNIPVGFIKYEWNYDKKEPAVNPNPDFITAVQGVCHTSDTILLICRSGGRSAKATDALAQAGFTNVYNIIDGMEGDMVNEPGNPNHGRRLKNGWKNAGLHWTYDVNPELLWISKGK